MTDSRLTDAHRLHVEAMRVVASAREKRDQRDRLICRVRAEDPAYWTYARLASEVGCSLELIAHIVAKGASADV